MVSPQLQHGLWHATIRPSPDGGSTRGNCLALRQRRGASGVEEIAPARRALRVPASMAWFDEGFDTLILVEASALLEEWA